MLLDNTLTTRLQFAEDLPGRTLGDGTAANPFVVPNSIMPYAPNSCIAFGPHYYDVGTGWSFNQDGYDNMKIIGFGAVLVYTGAGTISSMINFSGNIAALGNQGVEFKGFKLDGKGKVTGDMIFWRTLHNSTISEVSCVNGTGTACAIISCTNPNLINFRCTRFDMASQLNTFAHGLRADWISSTGNSASCCRFEGINISGTTGTGTNFDGCFDIRFEGCSEATLSGWGLEIGATTACQNVYIVGFDCETSGPIYAATGGHQGLHIVRCSTTTIINSWSFDASLVIESTAGATTCTGCQFYGVFHDTVSPLTMFGCINMDPNVVGQVVGAGYVRTSDNSGAGPLFPEMIIGRGSKGLQISQAMYDGFTAFASKIASNTVNYAMRQDPSGNTFIGGATLNANVPVTLASYTVATVPSGANGRIIYASNGRKVGEGAAAGTGVQATYSNGAWRRMSDETAVAA